MTCIGCEKRTIIQGIAVAYTMSWLLSVVNDLFTKFGCSSASTCKTRLAISACLDEAKGTLIVLREILSACKLSQTIYYILQRVPGFHIPTGWHVQMDVVFAAVGVLDPPSVD